MWCHGIQWQHRSKDGRHPTAGFASANMSHCGRGVPWQMFYVAYILDPAKWDWLNDTSSDFHFQHMYYSTVTCEFIVFGDGAMTPFHIFQSAVICSLFLHNHLNRFVLSTIQYNHYGWRMESMGRYFIWQGSLFTSRFSHTLWNYITRLLGVTSVCASSEHICSVFFQYGEWKAWC